MQKYVVSLGAGHGGFDLGTVGPDGLAEKDVTLTVAQYIGKRLRSTGAFEVVMARADDTYVGTAQRVRSAQKNGSLCHVEIHVDLTQEHAKSAAVWYPADMPGDGALAARLSRRMAKALEIPDCGARVRFDYCMLFRKLEGFEDYYSLIEALGVSQRHVFYCECGFNCGGDEKRRAGMLAAAMAEEVFHALCELYSVRLPVRGAKRFLPPPPAGGRGRPVSVREGFYNLRSGPGRNYPVVRVIEGLINTGYYERKNGWLKLSAHGGEYLSASAVDVYLNPYLRVLDYKKGDWEIETTGRDGFYFVLAGLEPDSEILGAVGAHTSFFTTYHGGYRQIFYCDRPGFVGPSAWSI